MSVAMCGVIVGGVRTRERQNTLINNSMHNISGHLSEIWSSPIIAKPNLNSALGERKLEQHVNKRVHDHSSYVKCKSCIGFINSSHRNEKRMYRARQSLTMIFREGECEIIDPLSRPMRVPNLHRKFLCCHFGSQVCVLAHCIA